MSEAEIIESNSSTMEIDDTLINAVKDAAREDNADALRSLTEDLHPADSASLMGVLSTPVRSKLILATTPNISPETLTYLDDDIISEMVELLGNEAMPAR